MTEKVNPIPQGYHTVTPHMVVRDCARAIEYYKQAFGAEEVFRMASPDGKVGHAEIKIGDSMIMLSDEYPEWGAKGPESIGGTPVNICLYVEDVDAVFTKAVEAGATVQMPVADQFWGDRYGKLVDPFGHVWSIATHVKDLTPEEIEEAAKKAMAAKPE